MTLLVEDLSTSQALDASMQQAVAGGIGPSGPIGPANLAGQSVAKTGDTTMVGSAASYGVLSPTLNLQLNIAPDISVQNINQVGFQQLNDLTNVVASAIREAGGATPV